MSQTLDFALVDAFTTVPLEGNPCAVILHADHLTDLQMQKIAKEMNQSETAFLMTSLNCDLKARYFTPDSEIPLAGHPTIASVHRALECGILSKDKRNITIELIEGPISVDLIQQGNQQKIKMNQRKPLFYETLSLEDVADVFSLEVENLNEKYLPQIVSTGTKQLMVLLKSLDSLKKAEINISKYKELRKKYQFFSPHLFCLEGVTDEGMTFARHLGIYPDVSEDAFTGSATGAMAAYLWKQSLLKGPKFIAQQGHWMGRPGVAEVEIHEKSGKIEGVSVSGAAVTVVSGKLFLR